VTTLWDETVSTVQLSARDNGYVQILAVFTNPEDAEAYARLFPRDWYLVDRGSDEGKWMPIRDDEHRRELQSRTVWPLFRTITVTACHRVPWNPPIALPPIMTPPPGVDGPTFHRRHQLTAEVFRCWHCTRMGHDLCHGEHAPCPHDPGPAHP